jgi:nucleoside-diphosphate-sugar epimerase
MRIVVTGAAGFIGSHLSEALVQAGHEVVGLDAFIPYYPREYKEANLRNLIGHPAFTFHEIDLRTADLAPLIEGASLVINEAAMPGLPRSWTDFSLYDTCNLLAVQRLAAACQETGVKRFLQASTSSIYGAHAVGDERLPQHPVSPYGVTKLAAEYLLGAYAESYRLEVVILRYFSVYGPRQRPDMAYHLFVEDLRRGHTLVVYGDGLQSRSATFVDDCVQATMLAMDGAEPGQAYNIGGGQAITLNAAISLLAEELGVEAVLDHRPPRPGDQRHTFANTNKARDTFGYQARVLPQEGLRRQVAWHLENLPLPPAVPVGLTDRARQLD